jgi:hypothetical protein
MRFILTLAILFLSACATTNAYKKLGTGMTIGGYDEAEIKPGVWKVTFQGQGQDTNPTNVYTSFLRRAADVTKMNGASHFKVTDGQAAGTVVAIGFASGSVPSYTGTVTLLKSNEPEAFSADEILAKYQAAKK